MRWHTIFSDHFQKKYKSTIIIPYIEEHMPFLIIFLNKSITAVFMSSNNLNSIIFYKLKSKTGLMNRINIMYSIDVKMYAA